MDWKLKTQAFLYGLSRAAPTLGRDRRAFAERLMEAAGVSPDTTTWVALDTADALAMGLDLPQRLPDRLDLFLRNPVLRHPLSGEKVDLSEWLEPGNSGAYLDTLVVAARALQPAQSDRQRFLTLWRGLWWRQEIVDAGLEPGLVDLLPPDPRVPLPSVWQHASLTSAFAGCGGDPALFTFTIASTQDFVATSRRTQDFWMGSFLLSLLAWAAMQAVAERCGPDALIYPDLKEQPLVDLWLLERGVDLVRPAEAALKIANFPNRFTALVPWAGAEKLGPAATAAIDSTFKDIAGRCLNAVVAALESKEAKAATLATEVGAVGGQKWHRIWSRQVEQLSDTLGVYYSVVRWDRAPEKSKAVDKVGAALAEQERLFRVPPQEHTDPIRQQIADGVEPNIGMLYAPVSKLSALSLDTRKHLRNFTNPDGGEPGEKCSLCGTRQALHPDGETDHGSLRQFWDRLRTLSVERPKFKLPGRVRHGERLCAVCFTRRLAWEHAFVDDRLKACVDRAMAHLLFPSAASVATAPFKRAVYQASAEDSGIQTAVARYVGAMTDLLQPGGQNTDDLFFWSAELPRLRAHTGHSGPDHERFRHLDGSWLYEESFELTSLRREFPGVVFDPVRVAKARRALGALLARMRLRARPRRYYTLVFMDGDKMGDWVSGLNALLYADSWHPGLGPPTSLASIANETRPLGASMHLALSAAMKHFALDLARPLVEDCTLGKLVYAGGDDAVALAPVMELPRLLRALRLGFMGARTDITEPLDADVPGLVRFISDNRWLLLPGRTFTASVGIAIVHHNHPFAHAMEAGFKAMKEHAKDEHRVNRDGYAIHLFKRAGTPLEFGVKWRQQAGGSVAIDTLEVLEQTIAAFGGNGCLSGRLPYAVAEVGAGLGSWGDNIAARENLEAGAAALLRALMDRHGLPGCGDRIAALHRRLDPLLRAWYRDTGHAQPPWERLRDLLLLARFLATEDDDR